MGGTDWDHLVDICINELHMNPSLRLVNAADIHEVVRAEVAFSKVPLYQQLAQIFAGRPAGVLEGFLAQANGRTAPGPAPPAQQNLELQPKPPDLKGSPMRQPLLPLKRSAEPPAEPSAAVAQPTASGDARFPTGQLTEGKGPVLVMTAKPPAKPLIPGGPCENPFCGVVEAPQWRRIDKKLVCNRCGMYYHRHARFPDWSYFNGLVSKQAVNRHVVVLHRGRQGASPTASAGSAPPPPPPQLPSSSQPQSSPPPSTQANAAGAAGSSTGPPSTETDTSAWNNRAGGSSGSTARNGGVADPVSIVSGSGAAGASRQQPPPTSPPVAPPLDQEVILKVLTKQWDQLDAATIRRVHDLLEQLQREQHLQPQAQPQAQAQTQAQAQLRVSEGDPQRQQLHRQSSGSDASRSPPATVAEPGLGSARRGVCPVKAEGASKSWAAELGAPQLQRQQRQSPPQQQQQQVLAAAVAAQGAGAVPPQGRSGGAAPSVAEAMGGSCSAAPRQRCSPPRRSSGGQMAAAVVAGDAPEGQSPLGSKVDVAGDRGSDQPPLKRMKAAAAGPAPSAPPARVLDAASGMGMVELPRRPPTALPQPPPQQPREQQQQELLLSPVLAAMLEHSNAVRVAAQQQQQQQQQAAMLEVQQCLAKKRLEQQQQQQQQQEQQQRTLQQQQQTQQQRAERAAVAGLMAQRPLAPAGPTPGSSGPRPLGRTLLETIAQAAQQQEQQQRAKVHQQQQQQIQQQQEQAARPWDQHGAQNKVQTPERMKRDVDAMLWPQGAAPVYDKVVDADGKGLAVGNGRGVGGGILMRDLQQRALLVQQQQLPAAQGSRLSGSGPSELSAPSHRGQSAGAAGAAAANVPLPVPRGGLAGAVPIAAQYDVVGQQLPGLAYQFASPRSGQQQQHQQQHNHHARDLYGGVTAAAAAAAAAMAHGYDVSGLLGPRGLTNVDNILELLRARGQGVRSRPGQGQVQQQSALQPQADALLEAAAASGFTPGVIGGLRQAPSGGAAGMVLLPVLDLGKPPTALAF